MYTTKEPDARQNVIWGFLFTVVIAISLYLYISFEPKTPSGIPWIGRRKELFSYLRAKIRMLTSFKDVLLEAVPYHKDGRAVLCALPIGPPQIVLPSDHLHWINTQPASVVSQDPLVDGVHKFLGTGLDGDLSLADLLRKKLARHDEKIPVIYEEIEAAFAELWGTSEEWGNIDLRSTLRTVNARIANRIFVGLPLCRNDEYLGHVMGFTGVAGLGTALYPLLPGILKPAASALIKAINRRHVRKCSQMLLPIVRQRFVDVEHALSDSKSSDAESRLPDDLVTWMVKKSVQSGEVASAVDAKIISRLIVANLPAIEASTNALWKSVLDLLLLADHDDHLVPVVKEAATVLEDCNFRPNKQSVSSLVRIDKAIKETLRHESLIGLPREITAPQGVTLDGTYLPRGTRVCISAVSLHFNEEIYANPDQYNPCRGDASHNGTVKPDNTSMARATDSYLSFGFGRRACPGRFVVTDQMKLTIAHIFTKYEIEVVRKKVTNEVQDIRIRYKPAKTL